MNNLIVLFFFVFFGFFFTFGRHTGPIDFTSISSNLTIIVDVSIYCSTAVYCGTCSIESDRNSTICQGSTNCGATCNCGCTTTAPTSYPTVDIFDCDSVNNNSVSSSSLLMNQTLDIYDIFFNVNNLPGWWENSCNICQWDIDNTNIVCDENQTQIIEINLSNHALSGSLTLLNNWPQTVKKIDLSHNNLIGTINWMAFDNSSLLEELYLNDNNFNGTIDLKQFGSSVAIVNLSLNNFNGKCLYFLKDNVLCVQRVFCCGAVSPLAFLFFFLLLHVFVVACFCCFDLIERTH